MSSTLIHGTFLLSRSVELSLAQQHEVTCRIISALFAQGSTGFRLVILVTQTEYGLAVISGPRKRSTPPTRHQRHWFLTYTYLCKGSRTYTEVLQITSGGSRENLSTPRHPNWYCAIFLRRPDPSATL